MRAKVLHYHARKAEAYDDDAALIPYLPYLDMEKVDMVYIDACCVFFTLQQIIFGPGLLIYEFKVRKGVDVKGATLADLKYLTQAMAEFVVEQNRSCHRPFSHSRMTCLVSDSGPKERTSAQPSARASQALNAAKSSYRKRHTRDRVLNYASACTRFIRAIISPIFQMLPQHQCHGYEANNLEPLAFLVADRETDAQVAHLVIPVGGSLQFFHLIEIFSVTITLNFMLILEVKWEHQEQRRKDGC
ncbi:hypothetical protein BCR43DRAFT_485406 [Syncephalastrum racemosum]|uniref:Uncharacterized protein n=1 Tax=Syncephalastrum racemosum TaxID=13706 RepID=A0A1X2HMC1_SYNRA|nr:hypothetical protein BCR43DRAFT_485406 [Syncephalastrum racemosum]